MSQEKNEQRVPKLRFKGFTDDWMQEKGKEIFNKRSENTTDSDNFELDIGLENLASNSGILIGDTSVRTNSNSVFQKNDTLFGRLRPYLNKWWYATSDGLKSGEIWAIYPKESIDSLFVYYLIQTDRFLYYANISSGTRMPRASWEIITDKVFSIPAPDEQKVIAKLLYKLEKIITLEQEKLTNYKLLKKGLIQNIFPKNSQVQPKLRYKGFNTEWKSTQLGEVVTLKNGYSFKSDTYDNIGDYKIITISNVKGELTVNTTEANRINELPENIQSHQILSKGDILVSMTGNVGRVSIVDEENNLLNQRLGVLVPNSKKFEPDFFLSILQTTRFEKSMINKGQGAAQMNIGKNDIENYQFMMPTSSEERKLIGKKFSSINKTIVSLQSKINNYKNIRVSLFNNLFI